MRVSMFVGRGALVTAVLFLLLSHVGSARAQSAPAPDGERLTRMAQLFAGIEPSKGDPVIDKWIATKDWQQHRDASKAGFKLMRQRLANMKSWGQAQLAPKAPATQTLVYPFSGPDFLNAYALFPSYEHYVFFSLEPIGAVPDLNALTGAQFAALLRDLRGAMNDLVHLNFFITPHMEKGMKTDHLSGITPVLMTMMAIMDLRVDRIEPFSSLDAEEKKPAHPIAGLRISFSQKDGSHAQKFTYLAFDVSDHALPAHPEFFPWLEQFSKPTVFMKSASYLLHNNHFLKTRDYVLQHAALVVQDDSGMPYRRLKDNFDVSLYGDYEMPVKLFENRMQKDLAAAFAANADHKKIPFPFGYNWRREGKSFVIVARRRGS